MSVTWSLYLSDHYWASGLFGVFAGGRLTVKDSCLIGSTVMASVMEPRLMRTLKAKDS